MNYWTELSIEYANQKSYLDDLFQVYPTVPEGIRDIDQDVWGKIEKAFHKQSNDELIRELFKLELFPIKDSYVAFLKRDPSSFERNPKTINRLAGRLYEMGLDKIYERCAEPKETNRQIGPFFRRWLNKKYLGIYVIGEAKFLTDFGGHQNAQFNDAIATLQTPDVNAVKIAILDGVLYIKGNNKMYRDITTKYSDLNIMSALVLREFLYQI